jgi:hypothetical protein
VEVMEVYDSRQIRDCKRHASRKRFLEDMVEAEKQTKDHLSLNPQLVSPSLSSESLAISLLSPQHNTTPPLLTLPCLVQIPDNNPDTSILIPPFFFFTTVPLIRQRAVHGHEPVVRTIM